MRFQYPTFTTLVPDSFVIYFIGHEGTVITEDVSLLCVCVCVLLQDAHLMRLRRNAMRNQLELNQGLSSHLHLQVRLHLVGC